MVSLSGHNRGNLRFALNSVTTSGLQDDVSVTVTSNFGRRSGSAGVTQLDDASLAQAVVKSEEVARLAPENAEFMPPLEQQTYLEGRAYSAATASAGPGDCAKLCRPVLDAAVAGKVSSAGFLEVGAYSSAMANSKGLFVHDTSTLASFTVSARTADGTGSGWAGNNSHDLASLGVVEMGRTAVRKTIDSARPTALDPGKYAVILEPSAVADLVGMMFFSSAFNARPTDEGRSFMTRKGGGSKVGEKVFSDKVHLLSHPQLAAAPSSIYSDDGQPNQPRTWVEGGVVRELMCGRFWAQKQGRAPVPSPGNLILRGGVTSTADMILNTKRGLLVTRLWYIREVDPQTLVFTGLTRDGIFLIENGRVTRPVKNFRFNESPVAMLNNIEAMGPSVRARGSEVEDFTISVPNLLVKDFTFSSVSDAV